VVHLYYQKHQFSEPRIYWCNCRLEAPPRGPQCSQISAHRQVRSVGTGVLHRLSTKIKSVRFREISEISFRQSLRQKEILDHHFRISSDSFFKQPLLSRRSKANAPQALLFAARARRLPLFPPRLSEGDGAPSGAPTVTPCGVGIPARMPRLSALHRGALHLGTVLPGLGQRTLRPPDPAAFAAFVLPRPAIKGRPP